VKFKRSLLIAVAVSVITAVGVAAMRLDWFEPQPVRDERAFSFSDGFENAATFRDLFPPDRSRWHGRQLMPDNNAVELTTDVAHSGSHALKCSAVARRGGVTSKADVERAGLHFANGDHVWSECWLLLKGGGTGENVFLWDLETTQKWQSPGRRLYLQSGGVLASDLGKWFRAPTFRQPRDHAVRFPRDRWVQLRVHLFLSDESDGTMEVWQDGAKVIDARGQTLPTAKTVYDRLQVGITANGSTEHAYTLYVDDVVVSNRPLP
jgi:hypothetical protein